MCISCQYFHSLRWPHNGPDSVSNQQLHDCLLNRLLGCRSKKHQSSASLAFVRGIHRGPGNSPHKWPVTRKMFPFDDVIMCKIGWLLFYYPLAFQVFTLPAPVRKLYFVRTITHHRSELESPKWHQICIMWYSRLVLKTEVIDLDLQCHFGHFDPEFYEIRLVRATTLHRFGLKSPNLHQIWSWNTLGWYWKWRSLTMTFKAILAILT